MGGGPSTITHLSSHILLTIYMLLCLLSTSLASGNHTTGNGIFAECKLLCRVSKIEHSAKTFFTEYRTRQRVLCRVLGTWQKKALGKGPICRVPGSRQKRGTRHRLPRVTVFGHVLLCRVPAVRHSAKIFFLKKILCRVPLTRRSAKIQYFF